MLAFVAMLLALPVFPGKSGASDARLVVESERRELVAGESIQLRVMLKQSDGRVKDVTLASTGTRYETPDAVGGSSVIRVSRDGRVTTITSPDRVRKTVSIMISNIPTQLTMFYSIDVIPSSGLLLQAPVTVLEVGSSVRLTVKRPGQPVDLSTEAITFASTDSRIASVDADGLVIARSTRRRSQTTIVIVAVIGSETGSIRLVITPQGGGQE
jgi:uncharacterized protein YjdB